MTTTRLLAVLLAAAIIVIVALADVRSLGPLGVVYEFPYGDKVGHFLLFGLLSLLVNLAAFEKWPRVARPALAARISLTLAFLIGLEELSQKYIPSRTFSLSDLAASYLGVALFAGIALVIDRRRKVAG